MTKDSLEPTKGQLERTLAQRLQGLYRTQLGHQPGQVTCNIFDAKVVMVLENAITQPEQLLIQTGQHNLAEQVRAELEGALDSQLRNLIQDVLGVAVTDLLNDATFETGRTGIIAILEAGPKVRELGVRPKVKTESISVSSTAEL